MKIKAFATFAVVVALLSTCAYAARTSRDDSFSRRGMGDEVLLEKVDEGIPRKEPGILFNRRDKMPPEQQFAAAAEAFKADDLSGACSMYDTLVRSFPFSKEAPVAQSNLAQLLERRGKYAKAFEEYAYLLEHYPEKIHAGDVLEHMFAIANWYFADGRLSDSVKYFERIAKAAPGWGRTAEAYYHIGLAELELRNWYEAADAFDTLSVRFPASELVPSAAEKHSMALYALSLKYREDEAIQRRAISLAVTALKAGSSDSPDHATVAANLDDLVARRDARAFAIARFYDTPRFNRETRIAAYEDFIRKTPQAPQVGEARRRLAMLKESAKGADVVK